MPEISVPGMGNIALPYPPGQGPKESQTGSPERAKSMFITALKGIKKAAALNGLNFEELLREAEGGEGMPSMPSMPMPPGGGGMGGPMGGMMGGM